MLHVLDANSIFVTMPYTLNIYCLYVLMYTVCISSISVYMMHTCTYSLCMMNKVYI